jgi:hypothetical protein
VIGGVVVIGGGGALLGGTGVAEEGEDPYPLLGRPPK